MVFLAASLAAHAAIIVLAPEFYFASVLPGPAPLEVTIALERPQPLPVEEPPARLPEPLPAPVPTARPKTLAPPKSPPRAPVAVLPAPGPAHENPLAVPEPPPAPEPQPAPAPPAGGKGTVAVTPPSHDAAYLRNPPPQYPMASRTAGEEGTVILRVLVTRQGLPGRVEIRASSGWHNLDNAARDAVWKWRFVPARDANTPVEATMDVPITFRLKEPGPGLGRSR